MRRRLVAALGAIAAAWLAFGGWTLARRAPRVPAAPGELRGAWHVHTTRSDGLGTVDDVVEAARAAGLQFVVVSDHNALTPSEGGYRGGVLVVQATEISSAFGHVVALGLPAAPGAEAAGDPLGRIAAAGGAAVIAHPLHPRRPFTGWGTGPWQGFEVASNDSGWYQALADAAVGRILPAALALPFDPAQTVLWLGPSRRRELDRFDAEAARARSEGRALPAIFCSADAHGYPSYGAAFRAFSMRVPVAPTGDATVDAQAVVAALLGGSASCVFDGVAPAARVRMGPSSGGALELSLEVERRDGAAFVLLRDGRPVERQTLPAAGPARLRFCAEGCAPGVYRVEGTLGGRPWIFTNPVSIG